MTVFINWGSFFVSVLAEGALLFGVYVRAPDVRKLAPDPLLEAWAGRLSKAGACLARIGVWKQEQTGHVRIRSTQALPWTTITIILVGFSYKPCIEIMEHLQT